MAAAGVRANRRRRHTAHPVASPPHCPHNGVAWMTLVARRLQPSTSQQPRVVLGASRHGAAPSSITMGCSASPALAAGGGSSRRRLGRADLRGRRLGAGDAGLPPWPEPLPRGAAETVSIDATFGRPQNRSPGFVAVQLPWWKFFA